MSVTLDKNAVQLAVIDGMIQESHETGFAQVTTHALNIMRIRYADLLAALEESQQQVEEQRDINEGVRVMARDWHAEAKHWKTEHERSQGELVEAQQQRDIDQANYKTYYAEAIALTERLVEAQQTIARHETALNEIIAYSTDENAVDVASVSMGYVEGEKTDGM